MLLCLPAIGPRRKHEKQQSGVTPDTDPFNRLATVIYVCRRVVAARPGRPKERVRPLCTQKHPGDSIQPNSSRCSLVSSYSCHVGYSTSLNVQGPCLDVPKRNKRAGPRIPVRSLWQVLRPGNETRTSLRPRTALRTVDKRYFLHGPSVVRLLILLKHPDTALSDMIVSSFRRRGRQSRSAQCLARRFGVFVSLFVPSQARCLRVQSRRCR